MGWLIAAGILLLLLLLFLARIRVRVRYDGEMRLDLQYLFFTFPLSPAKVKKLRLRDYRIDRFRRRRIRERAKAIKKAAEQAEKDAAKKKKKEDAKKEAKEAASKGGGKPKKSLKKKLALILGLVRDVGLVFLGRFWGRSRVEVKKLHLVIALGDAAKTAEGYGAACAVVSNLLAFLDSTMMLKVKDGAVSVFPDFLGDKPRAEVDVVYGISLWSILRTAVRAGVDALGLLMKQ